jgi:Lrp/AsnC family transcriptional regulator for asnA, asnC and gidA
MGGQKATHRCRSGRPDHDGRPLRGQARSALGRIFPRPEGVLQVVAVTDPLQMGFARQAMIGIKVNGNIREVAAELATMHQLDYIVITTGRFDILAEIVAESDDELLDIVSAQIGALDRVVSTETFVYLRLEKQTYSWGVR